MEKMFDLTFVGLLIVFAVLFLIAIVIGLVRKLDEGWIHREKEASNQLTEKQQNIDDTTLVLISTAVATMVGGRFFIHRVRVLPTNVRRTPWSSQGRAVLLGSHTVNRKTLR